MASKKYIFLAALFLCIEGASFAQTSTTDWGWNWKDTSKVPVQRMPQQNEFLNNQFPYPARPRDQWELGFAAGPSFIAGDIKGKAGLVGGISLRKALGHIISLRAGYWGAFNSGSPNGFQSTYAHAYKSQTHIGSMDVIVSLNTPSYYRANPKWNFYLLGGYDLIATQVKVQDAAGNYHIFYGIGQTHSQENSITTFGGATINNRHGWTLLHGLSYGGGIALKVSDKINLGLEQRLTATMFGYDYLDGYKGGNGSDIFSFTTARLNINIGSPAKRVQPLWWLNPNNFAYSELNSPKHMKMPKVVLPDADGDGVTDQFDLEPNTPAGAPVDSHGVAKDTDGDGVPDYKDKELLTPQKCFPVNNDGVGTCPEPACCKENRDEIAKLKEQLEAQKPADLGSLPSIQFKPGSSKLSKQDEALLNSVADKMKANPNSKIKLIGYGASSKAAQQLSWERVNAVKKYLVEKQGISENRIIFTYGQEGDPNTVDIQSTTEDGPSTVPAPHPNLKSKH